MSDKLRERIEAALSGHAHGSSEPPCFCTEAEVALQTTQIAVPSGLEALREIATMTGDMPAAYNDEAGWFRGRFYAAVGVAARALAAADKPTPEAKPLPAGHPDTWPGGTMHMSASTPPVDEAVRKRNG